MKVEVRWVIVECAKCRSTPYHKRPKDFFPHQPEPVYSTTVYDLDSVEDVKKLLDRYVKDKEGTTWMFKE